MGTWTWTRPCGHSDFVRSRTKVTQTRWDPFLWSMRLGLSVALKLGSTCTVIHSCYLVICLVSHWSYTARIKDVRWSRSSPRNWSVSPQWSLSLSRSLCRRQRRCFRSPALTWVLLFRFQLHSNSTSTPTRTSSDCAANDMAKACHQIAALQKSPQVKRKSAHSTKDWIWISKTLWN